MTVAIDIDGVLTDLKKYLYEEGSKFLNKEVVNPNGSDIDDIFDVPVEEKHRFWNALYHDYICNIPVRPKAAYVIDELKKRGFKILIVTARKFKEGRGFVDEEDFKCATIANLQKNGIHYDELHFVPRPKVDAVTELSIDVFIEDDSYNIECLIDVAQVIIMDAPYNKHITCPNTHRVSDWDEVLETILDITKK